MTRVAFQGELGAFSEEAVVRLFGEGATAVPCRDFAEVGRAVTSGEVDFGVLPIENSLAGSVIGSYDVLGGGTFRIVGEVITPIHHNILGVPGSTLSGLRRIVSHPVALAQCTRILRELSGVEALAVYDTAGAARDVAAEGDLTQAAIAGNSAASRYGLTVLARNVEDRDDNQTRFLAIIPADAELRTPPRRASGTMKTALLLETSNEPGALLRVLSPLAGRGLNLSKLESRPAGEPWSYRFFLEFDGDSSEPAAAAALEEVRSATLQLHILGSYPRWLED
ncbi:MAG: prephenate dehydratase [Gemmatimonadota bacterium]|nr:prephenate dehydratase [Gemmatimonadota bacterium]